MGYQHVARMLELLPGIPDEAQGLAFLLAYSAHDSDDPPCVWASPKTLTAQVLGEWNSATKRRFERRVVMQRPA